MSAATIGLAIAILYNSRKANAARYSDKYIFSYRFLLWPLQPYSQIVFWSVIFNHGLEYLALIQHMLKVPGVENRSRTMFIAATLLGMALISFYVIFNFIYAQQPNWVAQNWWFAIFMALYPFLTLLHYAIDGVVYRMSDQDDRGGMPAGRR